VFTPTERRRYNAQNARTKKAKGAFVSESALHFDGDKPNSVVPLSRDPMIIYLAAISRNAREPFRRS